MPLSSIVGLVVDLDADITGLQHTLLFLGVVPSSDIPVFLTTSTFFIVTLVFFDDFL